MLINIFKAVLITSLAGTALAAVLAMLKPITRRFFSGNWHYCMWLSVLIVMLVPLNIRLPEKQHQTIEPVSLETEVQTGVGAAVNTSEQEQILAENAYTVSGLKLPKAVPADMIKLSAMLWLAGAAALFLARLAGYSVFLAKLKKHSSVVILTELAEFTDRKIVTRISDTVSSPFMTGIFKPVLVLPRADFKPEQLHNILEHEMTHFRRKDILCKWLATTVKCIHWFNPAVYFICGRINAECEISCDLAVVRNMTKEQETSYIETILSLLLLGDSKPAPLTTGMAGSKKTLKERFLMIRNKKKISRKAVILSVVLAAAVIAVTAFAGGVANGRLNKGDPVGTDAREGSGFNALVMGVDEDGRADTVTVVSVGNEGINAVSIPRNTEFNGKRISNLAAEENGCEKAVEAVRSTLSIPINYYVRIETGAIEDIVNAAGGVEFDVPTDMEYDDPYKDLHIDLKKGRQLLDGEKAVQLLQYRRSNSGEGYENGDFTRIEVGQAFIKALAYKLIGTGSVDNVAGIYRVVSGIETNYSVNDLISDVPMLNGITADKITFATVPGEEEYLENGVFYRIDLQEADAMLDVFRN